MSLHSHEETTLAGSEETVVGKPFYQTGPGESVVTIRLSHISGAALTLFRMEAKVVVSDDDWDKELTSTASVDDFSDGAAASSVKVSEVFKRDSAGDPIVTNIGVLTATDSATITFTIRSRYAIRFIADASSTAVIGISANIGNK